ncbi:MAG: hydrogenase [Candidatus Hecatellales archaeon]|nr:MAG: hydrogenase [Candidatus Hecatellales archaeon]
MILKSGKVPAKILEEIVFKHLGVKSKDIVLGPRKGEDSAVVKVGRSFITVSCDPISGAVKKAGWLALNICCNDVAAMGVQPKWFLSCLMFPEKTSKKTIKEFCRQLDYAAHRIGVSIIGGHCEITPSLASPLIVGFAMGVAKNGKYIASSGAKPRDKIVLTKTVGIEGTAILASDRGKVLAEAFGWRFVREAEKYLGRVSIVREALTASKVDGVTAMHDPTEGGIVGGLWEIAEASNVGFKVYTENIPISQHTKKICEFFKVNPFKLISSGCLLLTVKPSSLNKLLERLRKAGVKASVIGEVLKDKNVRVFVDKDGREKKVYPPAQDELWVALERKV